MFLRVVRAAGGNGVKHEYVRLVEAFRDETGKTQHRTIINLGRKDLLRTHLDLEKLTRLLHGEEASAAEAKGEDVGAIGAWDWGGMLAVEYALTYQQHLRGLVISNMMASVPAYNEYAERVLMAQMDPAALAEIKAFEAAGDTEDPRYMELLMEQHYVHHVLRMPPADWPDPVQRAFAHINPAIYVSMQGPSELGISADASLSHWERTAGLASIEVPTLVIGAQHDTMDPAHMKMMAGRLPRGRYLHCPDGSHMAMYDDQQVYFAGLIGFLRDLAGPVSG